MAARRMIGFSTGSLCGSDFRTAVDVLKNTDANAIELSALREHELQPLLAALHNISLEKYKHVSVHAPSAMHNLSERAMVKMLRSSVPRGYAVIVHADIVSDFKSWRELGSQLCIENMDKRKSTGRTVREMQSIFDALPKASLCLDFAHARQVDPSLSETVAFLIEFRKRLRQIHLSELNSASKHEPLSFAAVAALQSVRDLIPAETPIILEFFAEPHALDLHMQLVTGVLQRAQPLLRLEVG